MNAESDPENSKLDVLPRILIVDDEPLIRAGIKALLNREGYDLQFAEDGFVGLEMALKGNPDVILLDVMMLGMDGFEFCKKIRESKGLSDVPVVFISALDDKEARLKGFEAGADEYLAKPFDGRELMFRLRTLTRLNRYRKIVGEQKRFEWVFENSPEALVVLGGSGNILNLNSSACLWLACTKEDNCLGGSLQERLSRLYSLVETSSEDPNERAGNTQKIEIWFKKETDQSKAITLEVRYGQHSRSAESSLVVQIREISDQEEFRTMSQVFMNLISHKMLTPLNILQGSLEVLKIEHPEVMEGEYGLYIQQGIDQLLSQTQKILAMTTQNFNKSDTLFPLNEVQELAEKIAIDVGLSDHITFKTADAIQNLGVRMSIDFLSMFFMEGLTNAKKFHPTHSPIVEIGIELADQDRACFRIDDDGVHLSPKQLQDALKPFVQAEKYFTGNVPGWGIGLNVLRRMVHKLGGEIRLANREGQSGVRLEFVLPCEVSILKS
jgi:two-component system, cell cycle response regulator